MRQDQKNQDEVERKYSARTYKTVLLGKVGKHKICVILGQKPASDLGTSTMTFAEYPAAANGKPSLSAVPAGP